MQRAPLFRIPSVLVAGLLLPGVAQSGITVYEDGPRFLEVGGRVQVQYNYSDPDDASSTDDFDIRRAWLTFDGSVAEDWEARLQFQLDGGYSTKDAKIQYTGWEFATLTAGNFYVPFSREELTSSKSQQLIEKTPVAGTGSPARQIGASLSGGTDTFNWEAGLWEAGLANNTIRIPRASSSAAASRSIPAATSSSARAISAARQAGRSAPTHSYGRTTTTRGPILLRTMTASPASGSMAPGGTAAGRSMPRPTRSVRKPAVARSTRGSSRMAMPT